MSIASRQRQAAFAAAHPGNTRVRYGTPTHRMVTESKPMRKRRRIIEGLRRMIADREAQDAMLVDPPRPTGKTEIL